MIYGPEEKGRQTNTAPCHSDTQDLQLSSMALHRSFSHLLCASSSGHLSTCPESQNLLYSLCNLGQVTCLLKKKERDDIYCSDYFHLKIIYNRVL